jgi:transcriptional regulator NrdR family protein
MGKRRIFEVFNISTGMWESHMIDEDKFHNGMKKLNEESQVLDAEIKIINKIIEQQLNKKPSQLIESRD